MLQNILGSRKTSGGLILAGLAAFALYKYSKMSPDQKSQLTNNLREQGKKILGQVVPGMKSQGMGQESSNAYSGANL